MLVTRYEGVPGPIDVRASIDIARPRSEVAAFLEDPRNDLRWIRALSSAEPTGDGPLRAGYRVRRVARMMGRSMPYTTEVAEYEPAARILMRTVEGPFPMVVTYLLEDAPGGTRVIVRNQGGEGILFAIARPLIGWMVNSRVKGDLKALKSALES